MEVLYSINQTRYHMEIAGEADGTNGRFNATHIKSNAKISLPFSLSAVEEWLYAKKDSLIIFGDIVATFLDLYLLLVQEGKDDPGNTNRIIYKINVAAREAVIPPSRSHRGSDQTRAGRRNPRTGGAPPARPSRRRSRRCDRRCAYPG